MGVRDVLARLALRATKVLVVEVPGQWRTRVAVEQEILRRGWRPAWAPADADVLAVCGTPAPELADLVRRLWDEMPGPRGRADILRHSSARHLLDEAAGQLLDRAYQQRDARARTQRPDIESHHDGAGHEGHGGMNHEGHGGMDHEGHGGMHHEGHMNHEGHGGMDMTPEGIPLAQGGPDRDGLEMDILHLPLGPVLPFWPAGLVVRCALQGDVVIDAEASVIDGRDGAAAAPSAGSAGVDAAAVGCDNAMSLLALAGAQDAAALARRARDALVRRDQAGAQDAVERLSRVVHRSRLVRWSLRGVLPLDQSLLEHHRLPAACRGDAYDRLSALVELIRAGASGGDPATRDEREVPWEALPHLLTGLELGTVRLAVASLDLGSLASTHEVGHA